MTHFRMRGGAGDLATGRRRVADSRLLGVTGALVLSMALSGTARASEDETNWYDSVWPIGEAVHVEVLKDEYVPFKSIDEIPNRPALFIELGDPFLDTGKLDKGFEVPIIGAVWQPRLWAYFINRTAVQSFENEVPDRERESEIANRMDLYANLQLTGTEKILLGLRPTDQNEPGRFTRYTIDGADDGWEDEFNVDIETLFFEGDLGSLIPNLDRAGIQPIDFGFTVGRQPIIFQEGVLINDTIDAVGFVRNNIPFPGTSNLRISGMWAWNRLDRNDSARDNDDQMFALFAAADAPVSTFNLDMIYVDDDGKNGFDDADGFYVGASAIQRIRSLGNLSTAFRVNSSFALDDEVPGNVVGDGTLLTAEFSKTPHGSDDIAYFNPFVSIGNFTQAGREAINGGPLANTGILFASPNLSLYGSEIRNFVDDTAGFATGYQAFWDNKKRNLIVELAGRADYGGAGEDIDSLGVGFQLQQALGQHVQLQFEGFYTGNKDLPDGSGGRFEILVVY